MAAHDTDDLAYCSFCGKDRQHVKKLIQGGGKQPARELPRVRICDECIALCSVIVAAQGLP